MPQAKEYAGNAATGAMVGGTVGSVVPGVGTAVGAGAGALVGLGYTAMGGGNLLGMLSGGNVNSGHYAGPQGEMRQGQVAGINTLGNWATTGQGPSQAQSLLTQAREQNNAQAVSTAKSMAGGNPALQANIQSNMLAHQNAQTGYQSAQLRAAEQQHAMDGYMKGLQGARESDIDVMKARTAVDVHNSDAKSGFIRGLIGGAGGGLAGMF